jgi:hypothetical protein
VDGRGAAEAVLDAETNSVLVKHRLKNAADCAFLGPDLASQRLLIPEVAPIGASDGSGILLWIVPCRYPL